MPEFLVFTLAAPIASFGVGAGNFSRGSDRHPGHSLVAGLLGAALGLEREDSRLIALSDGLRVAVAMERRGAYLRDFHTIQSRRERKGPPPATRRLALSDGDPYTTISERDYVCDVRAIVAVSRESGPFLLEDLRKALKYPRFTLYFGRKSCPLAQPPAPEIVDADRPDLAMHAYRLRPVIPDIAASERRASGGMSADARLYPQHNGRRTRRRTLPAARSTWSYRLLDELTLGGETKP